MERMYWYAKCEQPKPSRTLSKTEAKAKVEETRKPESRMMRQVSSTVRRGTGGKGQQWTSPAVYPAINIVTENKPKVLEGLGQKGTVAGTRTLGFLVMGIHATGGQSAPHPFVVTETEHGNPVRLPRGKASRKASR